MLTENNVDHSTRLLSMFAFESRRANQCSLKRLSAVFTDSTNSFVLLQILVNPPINVEFAR